MPTVTKRTPYPKPSASVGQLVSKTAKEFLGWEPIKRGKQKKNKKERFFSHKLCGSVRLTKNLKNRYIYISVIKTLMQEILRGRWKLNGEPIIIGRHGSVLNGQHTMIALILATIEWNQNPERYPFWKKPPFIDKIVITGINEDEGTINTMDTCKPRSLTDVLDHNKYFTDLVHQDRRLVAHLCDHAIRFLWHRTGADIDAFSPRRTHAESLDFLNRHQKVLDAVRFIFVQDKEEGIRRYLSPGYAAALLYLMGASQTDEEEYHSAESPSEDSINFKLWTEACEFWKDLADNNQVARITLVRDAMVDLINNGGTTDERCALLIKCWLAWPIVSESDVELEYATDEEGIKHLVERPLCGGIDLHF